MRVIAGEARGHPLAAPLTIRTRPTTDKVKGAVFSMIETLLAAERPAGLIGTDVPTVGEPALWEGLTVLDLYAGTGALGIEALSRGAAWCDFVDSDARARITIERNLKTTALESRARVIGVGVRKVIGGGIEPLLHAPYGLVLMDPPYADPDVDQIVLALAGGLLLHSGALVAVEHSHRVTLSSHFRLDSEANATGSTGLTEVRRRRHGDTEVSIYRWQRTWEQEEGDHGHHRDLSR